MSVHISSNQLGGNPAGSVNKPAELKSMSRHLLSPWSKTESDIYIPMCIYIYLANYSCGLLNRHRFGL